MPRLGISMSQQFDERKAPAPDQFGRRVRNVNGVAVMEEKKPLVEGLYAKVAIGLALVATISMSVALWRLFTFPH